MSASDFATTPPTMTILADHAIHEILEDNKAAGDSFELNTKLAAVYDMLRHKNTQCPMAVGIYGDWGSGKTSAMRWLEKQLSEWNAPSNARGGHPRVFPIRFEPWKYHKREDVWNGIVAEVILAIVDKSISENTVANVKSILARTGVFLGSALWKLVLAGLKTKLTVKHEGNDLELNAEAIAKELEELPHKVNEFFHPEATFLNPCEEALKSWIAKNVGQDRYVLFIDDLDRCLPEVAMEVLEAIKLYLNIKSLIFVVGVDDAVVNRVVEKHYEKFGVDAQKSRHYLSKIFQVEMRVSPSEGQMTGYFDAQLDELNRLTDGAWNKNLGCDGIDKNAIEGVIQQLASNNPREVKRLLNSCVIVGLAAKQIKGADQLAFAQGVQWYLLQKHFEFGLFERFNRNVMVKTQTHHWFSRMCQYLRLADAEDLNPLSKVGSEDKSGNALMANMLNLKEDCPDFITGDIMGFDVWQLLIHHHRFVLLLRAVKFSSEITAQVQKQVVEAQLSPAPSERIDQSSLRNIIDDKLRTKLSKLLNRPAAEFDDIDDIDFAEMLDLLDDEDVEKRQIASEALGYVSECDGIRDALLSILCSEDSIKAGFAEYALQKKADYSVVQRDLQRIMDDDEESLRVRCNAARALGGKVSALPLWKDYHEAMFKKHQVKREAITVNGVEFIFLKAPGSCSLMQCPVTQGQWQKVMGENPSRFKGDHLPVESVSWEDCQRFIGKLNEERPRENFRFPSHAEWRFACAAGAAGDDFGAGFGSELTADRANFDGQYPYPEIAKKGVYRQRTTAEGSFLPNDWGFHDMHGNVWEWCEDLVEGSLHVLSGGGWGNYARFTLLANCLHAPTGSDGGVSFRLARGPKTEEKTEKPVAKPERIDGTQPSGARRRTGKK